MQKLPMLLLPRFAFVVSPFGLPFTRNSCRHYLHKRGRKGNRGSGPHRSPVIYRCAFGAAFRKETVKITPPSAFSAPQCQPWAWAMAAARASPRPEPPFLAVSPLKYGSQSRGRSSAGMGAPELSAPPIRRGPSGCGSCPQSGFWSRSRLRGRPVPPPCTCRH